MEFQEDILNRIPHRPPFLWVNEIIERDDDSIVTGACYPADLAVFQGHYPGQPLMPGVLLCEAIFQTGALLMSYLLENGRLSGASGVPVLTRIEGAKFKRMIRPGDTVQITVKLRETIGPASYMKGTLRVGDKVAVQVDFCCALAPAS